MDNYFKLPRLYSTQPLSEKADVSLSDSQAHYLKNVMRRKEGNQIRLFDGQNGEWLGKITNISKKLMTVALEKQIKEQPADHQHIRFVFSPIKKNRMDWMIEKMVELGVTEFQPILFQNTEVRKINAERMTAQIFEAAEQCERLTIPALWEIQKLDKFLSVDKFEGIKLACLERFEHAQDLKNIEENNISFLIGPEGGFTEEEKHLIAQDMKAINLGETIYRCETAAIKMLVLLSK
ncbi:MAG: RsmE family RNA methyltransferase [Pseudomonadota bacterium]